MANNLDLKDAASVTRTVKSTETASVHTPHHNVDTIAAGASADLGATTEAEATGNGSLIAIAKRIRTLLGSIVTAVTGTLTVNASGAAVPVTDNSGSLTVDDGGGSLTVDGAVSVSASALPTGAATETTLGTRLSESDFDTKTGALTETAPATDTASSGLNGRLQRIAQRLTSLITALGSPFQAGGSIGNTSFGATQSGTWTVQPGNTANTTAWKVDASSVAVPITDNSGSLTVDAPVATPVFVRLSDGAAAISALPVTDNAGSLTVDNAGTFAVQDSEKLVDNAAFTDGTTKVQPAGYILDETAGTALTENDVAAARVNANRAQVLVIEDDATRGRRTVVKAASTAAAATDPALVVAVSPNNTVPVSLASVPSHAVTNAGTFAVQPGPTTSGGLSIQKLLSAATTNATSVKASAGQVYTIYAVNLNAAVRYLKLYNKASAPTVGTDTPVLTLPIPASTTGAGFVLNTGGMGIAFATGIALAVTTGVSDADTGAVAANEVILSVLYK